MYEKPIVEVIELEAEDVVCLSGGGYGDGNNHGSF